jgi:two-component system response regulator YesN
MLKVILIDDEQNVLVGLRYLIDWNAQGFELCGAFQSPKQALASIQTLHPDLIITDIEMPEISGLDLIATLHELSPNSICTILSAYDDFKYAQEAVRLGVFRYLLKPLSSEKLIELLMEVKNHFSSEQPDSTELSMVRSFVVREILLSGIDLCHASSLPYYRTLFENTRLQLLLVNIPPESNLPDAEMTDRLQAHFQPVSIFIAGDFFTLLLNASTQELTSDAAKRFLTGRSSFRLSAPFSGLSAGHTQYTQMAQSLQNEIFWGGTAPGHTCSPVPDISTSVTAIKELLLPAVWDPDSQALNTAFADLLTKLQACSGALSKIDVMRIYAEILTDTDDVYQNICAHRRGNRTDIVHLAGLPTLSEIHTFSVSEVRGILNDARAYLSQNSPNLIRKAKDYIQAHYKEADFRLSDIADALYVNYSYLSHLFKLETGTTLYSFLLEIRMQQAKLLLANPEFSITDISHNVGYMNTKTFYSTFKKYYKESPRKYQQRYLRRKKNTGGSDIAE